MRASVAVKLPGAWGYQLLKLVGFAPLRFTDGGLVVIQPKGRLVIVSYQNWAARAGTAVSVASRISGNRFFFIFFVGFWILPPAVSTSRVRKRLSAKGASNELTSNTLRRVI